MVVVADHPVTTAVTPAVGIDETLIDADPSAVVDEIGELSHVKRLFSGIVSPWLWPMLTD